MKIDYDFMRELLLKVGDKYDIMKGDNAINFTAIEYDGDSEMMAKSRRYLRLMIDAGILRGKITEDKIQLIQVGAPEGFNFMKTIEKDDIWELVKKKLDPINECPLDMVIHVARSVFWDYKKVDE